MWTAESAAILKAMANGDWGVNEPIDTGLFGSVSVDKYDAVTGQTPQGEATFAGAKFQVINSSKNAVVIGGKVIAPGGVCAELTTDTGTTDADGNLTFSRKIVFADGVCNTSSYFVREKEAPAGYVLDTTEHPVSCTQNNQTVSVTIENTPILGSIELRKQSSAGEAMKGVKFLLEYSLDGKTWTPVTKRDSNETIVPGSCISGSLGEDGTLTTDSSGIACFEGLRVFTAEGKAIRYRVTELQTLNGSSLMPDQIWEGDLSTQKDGAEKYEVVLGVVNSPVLELPKTGAISARMISILALLFSIVGALAVIKTTITKRSKRNEQDESGM